MVPVKVRHGGRLHDLSLSPDDVLGDTIAASLSIPRERLRLVARGKQLDNGLCGRDVDPSVLIMAVGRAAESEDGLHPKDIDVLMQQLSMERNDAVRALRQADGDLVDAMLNVGNARAAASAAGLRVS